MFPSCLQPSVSDAGGRDPAKTALAPAYLNNSRTRNFTPESFEFAYFPKDGSPVVRSSPRRARQETIKQQVKLEEKPFGLAPEHEAAGNHVVQRLLAVRKSRHDEADTKRDQAGHYLGEKAARGAPKSDAIASQVRHINA